MCKTFVFGRFCISEHNFCIQKMWAVTVSTTLSFPSLKTRTSMPTLVKLWFRLRHITMGLIFICDDDDVPNKHWFWVIMSSRNTHVADSFCLTNCSFNTYVRGYLEIFTAFCNTDVFNGMWSSDTFSIIYDVAADFQYKIRIISLRLVQPNLNSQTDLSTVEDVYCC